MKKFFLILLSGVIALGLNSSALAAVHRTQIANVSSVNSAFNYQDPDELGVYLQKKAQQEEQKNSGQSKSDKEQEKLTEPPIIFRVYVTNDRFYAKDDPDKYKERIDIGFTSHNMERNFIFDKDLPPYLIIDDGQESRELHFKEFKFDNPYWISFALTSEEIAQIAGAQKITAVLPEATENLYAVNKRKAKIEKKAYKKNIPFAERSFEIPEHIIAEWKEVLTGGH